MRCGNFILRLVCYAVHDIYVLIIVYLYAGSLHKPNITYRFRFDFKLKYCEMILMIYLYCTPISLNLYLFRVHQFNSCI